MKARRSFLLLLTILAFLLTVPAVLAAGTTLADFESGLPAGWFVFNGGATSITAVPQTVADSDALARPGQTGDNEVLSVTYTVGDFGGYGQSFIDIGDAQDWSSYQSFNFWFYGTGSGLAYQAEVSDNRSDPNTDTSERFDYTFTDDTPGWQFIQIPFADFTRATDFQPGGAPDDGFTLTEIYAWAIVLPNGADTIYMDDFALRQRIVDDFENGLPIGADSNGIPIGFYTFQGAGSSIAISTASTPPAPAVPGASTPNNVLQINVDSTSYAGLIHGFESDDITTWVPQDWSAYAGIGLWLYGNNSGSDLFIDLLENRNPGSTTDDAQRWTVAFTDNFSGWQYLEFPFDTFTVKGVGNGAPNDALTLEEMHGWAFGTLGTGGSQVYYIDDVSLYGVAELPELAVSYAAAEFAVTEGAEATITVELTRELGLEADDPAQVSVDYSVAPGTAVPDRDYTPVSGTLTFVQGGPAEQTFTIPTFDNPKDDGDKTVILQLSNLVDVAPGFNTQSRLAILDDEPFDPTLLDDFERGAYLWDSSEDLTLSTVEVMAGDPLALPGQGTYETILLAAPAAGDSPLAQKEAVLDDVNAMLPASNHLTTLRLKLAKAALAKSVDSDYWTNGYYLDKRDGIHVFALDGVAIHFLAQVAGTNVPAAAAAQAALEQLLAAEESLAQIAVNLAVANNGRTSFINRAEDELADGQADLANGRFVQASNHFYQSWFFATKAIKGKTLSPATFGRDFPIGQDWTRGEALTFWYYGSNSGDEITLQLKDNRAPDPGPSGWGMVWSDEFNDPAGTPPNPAHWSYEIGDGTANRIPGWGNSELQYYTSSTENSATDGDGNLVITAKEADGSLECYYGQCEYTSARLISQYKAEFAYGRIESRIQVPQGAGLWPAFWSLGTDIGQVGWPQTGEIDFMEFVGRLPNEVFGTIHGPGYSGGQSFGNIYDFGAPVYTDFHTFAIEWEPDVIKWYVDDILYHTATPADVAPNQWVFNDPVFLLLNVAIGGNFGGPVGADTTFPQEMVVDYVRVYQGPDTAERWETTFTDNFNGWQQMEIPFTALTRSADQPAGAPDDGLNLNEVWGYGFVLPDGGTSDGTVRLDQVQLKLIPPPTAITVTNLNNSGAGSLRQALADIAVDGTITFDPALAGGTIALTSGPLAPGHNVTIDAADAPGLSLNGGGVDRILVVNAGVTVNMSHLTVTNGYGYQLAGGILNNGNLTLDHVTVTGNTMTTDAGDFWQGGGGIYSGDGATLNLVDSSVTDNHAGWSGGGVYSFFNTTTNIVRSTIAGNVSNDVGGGLRLLGNGEIVNSTISGNEATGWYGGALFMTDGVVNMTNSTMAENVSPSGAAAAVFVGTFGPGSATLNVGNSIIAHNVTEGCFLAPFGAGTVAINSLGNNLFSDGTCFAAASDLIVGDAGLGVLADNGGPTQTHALLAGSAALDTAAAASCPATDQRGVARPQGAGCDIGAFEAE